MNGEITVKGAVFGKLCKMVLIAGFAACGVLAMPRVIGLLTTEFTPRALQVIAAGLAAIAAIAYLAAELIYYALSKAVFYTANFVRAVAAEFAKRNRAWQLET